MEAKNIHVTFKDWLEGMRATGCKVRRLEYGWELTDGKYSEWAVTVLFTARQDFRVSWLVALAEVDGRVAYRTGLDRATSAHEALVRAMNELVREAGWSHGFELRG